MVVLNVINALKIQNADVNFAGQTWLAACITAKLWRPYVMNTSANGVFFEDWFENMFVPCVPKGVTVILDNASFHRKKKLAIIASCVGVSLLF
jgi:hypothetical protein